jgi:hypothetical protein
VRAKKEKREKKQNSIRNTEPISIASHAIRIYDGSVSDTNLKAKEFNQLTDLLQKRKKKGGKKRSRRSSLKEKREKINSAWWRTTLREINQKKEIKYDACTYMKTMCYPYTALAIHRDYSDNPEKNILTTLPSTSSTTSASTATCQARGLAITHSHKLSTTLGGSTSTRSGVRNLILKTYDFVDINNAMIPTTLGGSTTTLPPIVIAIL